MPRPLGAVERLGIDRGENAVRQVVAEVPADAGEAWTTGMPCRSSSSGGPIPESRSSLGVSIAPAASTTSWAAWASSSCPAPRRR